MTSKLKVTALLRGGVGSNRRRTGSPQDDELDSAVWCDEPARSRRSLEVMKHAGVADKAVLWPMTWLEAECWEVCVR